MTQPLKTRLEKLKEGCKGLQGMFVCEEKSFMCKSCKANIFLLSQIIDDLKKEWQRLDKHKDETELWEGSNARCEHSDCHCEAEPIIEFIEQLTGISSEELKK